MRSALIFTLMVFVSMFSCTKRICGCDPSAPIYYRAEILETSNIDCGKPTLTIDPADAVAVRAITGATIDTYIADGPMDPALNVVGQKLFVLIRMIEPSEDFACTTMGPGYPHFKLLHAIERN